MRTGCGLPVIRFPDQCDFSVETAEGPSLRLGLVAAAVCDGQTGVEDYCQGC